MADRQIREIIVRSDVQGDPSFKKVVNGLKDVNKSVKDTTNAIQGLGKAYVTLQGLNFAGIGLSNLTEASDTYQKLSDRIKVFSDTQEEANKTLDSLAGIAQRTRTSVADVATGYSRLSLALKESGLQSSSVLFLTEQLQNAFKLQGATGAETSSVLIQLSQGLATGALRGQELNSVLEGSALIGGLLAKQLGITRGELKKAAEAGRITNEVFIQAISKGAPDLTAKVSKLGITFQEANEKGLTRFNTALGKLNLELGASAKYNAALEGLADNLSLIGAAATGLAVASIPSLITALSALRNTFVGTLIVVNPVVAALGALAAGATYAYLEFDKFSQIGLELRSSFVIAFTDINEVILQTIKSVSLLVSFGKGDFLTDFANGALENTDRLRKGALDDLAAIRDAAKKIEEGNKAVDLLGTDTFEQRQKAFLNDLKKGIKGSATASDSKSVQVLIRDLNTAFNDGKVGLDDYNKRLRTLSTELYAKKGPIPLMDELAKLDREELGRNFEAGRINAEKFQEAVNKLDLSIVEKKNKAGRLTNLQYAQSIREITDRAFELNEQIRNLRIRELSEEFQNGVLNLGDYNTAVRAIKVEELNDKFRRGTIDVYAYNKALTEVGDKFRPGSALITGLNDYIQSAGTLSQGISTAVTQTFGRLEDAIVDFTKNGKFAFKDFANAVLEDLNRIILRSLVIRPLAEGILGSIGGTTDRAGGTTQYSQDYLGNTNAKGNAFTSRGVEKFASGGVVNRTTPFKFGSGQNGIMGEAGPEGILPLKRNKNGDLGVQTSGSNSTTVNIINQSGGEVEQSESTDSDGNKTLQILIHGTVKEGLQAGIYDKQFSNQYGLRRRGQ